MDMERFLSGATIPIMMAAVLIYYAVRLLVLHDVDSIRGKNTGKKLKNEEMYAKEAGKLMLFLAVGSLAMAGIMYWNTIAAFVVIFIWVIIFAILWKKMDEKYGG